MSLSDSGTSSLSELEEETLGTTGESVRDIDSEAETERLDPSPSKLRKETSAGRDAGHLGAPSAPADEDSSVESEEQDSDPKGLDDAPSDDLLDESRYTRRHAISPTKVPAPYDLAGKKRKRTISGSMGRGLFDGEGSPPKKRTSSSRGENSKRLAFQRLSRSSREAAIARDEGVEQDEDALNSSDEEETRQAEGIDETDDLDVPRGKTEAQGSSNEDADGTDVPTPEPEDGTGEDDPNAEGEIEAGNGSRDEIDDEEEADAAAKTDAELAKKHLALEELKPIERMFAILRDRIFDDRLAALSEELELLNNPNPTHPDFLAMRQTLDARRDEKVQHEKILLGYNLELAKKNAVGKHHQYHSQYAQMVRDTREKNLGELNKLFCGIKHELREWEPKEPHFTYQFETNRSQQVAQQTSYNKEVSILSGLAHYVGFPAAPEMNGASSAEIEADFLDMKLKRPQVERVAKIHETIHLDSLVAEEQFIESTPWANPKHPVMQQVLTRERQSSAQPPQALPEVSATQWIVDIQGPKEDLARNRRSHATSLEPSSHIKSRAEISPSDRLNRAAFEDTNTQIKIKQNDEHTSSPSGAMKLGVQLSHGLPYDATAVQQPYQTSAIHSNAVNDLLATAPVGPQSGFGTPGPSLLARPDTQDQFARRNQDEGSAFPFPSRGTPFSGGAQRISVDQVGGQ